MAKIKIEQIVEESFFHNWKLISKEYINLNTQMEWECPNGHIVYAPYKKIRDSYKCPFCEKEEKEGQHIEIQPKTKGTTRVLALDQATQISGWAIYDDKDLVAYGKIDFTQTNVFERISKIRQWLINMITNWQIDRVALEDIQLQKFTKSNGREGEAVTTYKTLAQLQGTLAVTIFEQKIDAILVSPATWRSHCKIKAKSRADQKRAAQLLVQQKFGQNVTQDEADAICIGLYIVERYLKNNEIIDFDNL